MHVRKSKIVCVRSGSLSVRQLNLYFMLPPSADLMARVSSGSRQYASRVVGRGARRYIHATAAWFSKACVRQRL